MFQGWKKKKFKPGKYLLQTFVKIIAQSLKNINEKKKTLTYSLLTIGTVERNDSHVYLHIV